MQTREVEATHCFQVLQQWEGTVQSLDLPEFTARMTDLTNSASPLETFVLDLEDVAEWDRPIVVPGGVFYMTVGYRVATYGEQVRSTLIRFRRWPCLSRLTLDRARARASAKRFLLGE